MPGEERFAAEIWEALRWLFYEAVARNRASDVMIFFVGRIFWVVNQVVRDLSRVLKDTRHCYEVRFMCG